MAMAVRVGDGRFENADRAFAAATERQRDQLMRLFAAAGLPAQSLLFGHSGTLSNAALAKLINFAVRSRTQIDEIDPHRYGLEP
jgi:hypothetical protein